MFLVLVITVIINVNCHLLKESDIPTPCEMFCHPHVILTTVLRDRDSWPHFEAQSRKELGLGYRASVGKG